MRGLEELWESHEIVGSCGEREHEADTRCPAVRCLAQDRHRLDVAAAFDRLADTWADQIAGVAPTQPAAKALAAGGPAFPVAIDLKVESWLVRPAPEPRQHPRQLI